MIKETRQFTHEFSSEELETLGKDLSEMVESHGALDFEKKQKMKSYNEALKAKMEIIHELACKINTGQEVRDVACQVEMNTPVYGRKKITRLDTGAYWDEAMEPEEFDLFNQETAMAELTEALGEEIDAFKGTKASIKFHGTEDYEGWEEE